MSFFSKLKSFFTGPDFDQTKLGDSTEISLNEIRALIFQEKFQQAKTILDRELKTNSKNPELQFLHAHWFHLQKRFSEADAILTKLVKTNPLPQYLLEFAQVTFSQDHFDQTETICNQLLQLEPENHEAIFLLTRSLLSRITSHDFEGDPLSPESLKAQANLKDKYQDQVGFVDRLMQLIPSLQKILKAEPDNRQPLELLAEIFTATGDEQNLTELLKAHPSRFVEGKIKFLEGKFEEASQIFTELVKEDAQNARRLQNLAMAEEKNDHPEAALKLFQKVLELDPQSLTARKHFQQLAAATGSDSVLAQFEQSLKNNSRGELFSVFASILAERQDFDKALQFFAKAVDFGTKDKTTIHQFAELAKDSLPPLKSQKVLEHLTKKFPEDQKLLDLFLEIKKTSLGKA